MSRLGLDWTRPIPFAWFSHGGSWHRMDRETFDAAVRAGERCGCGSCLDCRALEYWTEAGADLRRETGAEYPSEIPD